MSAAKYRAPELIARRCDCENLLCKVGHKLGACQVRATARAVFGVLCGACAVYMPPIEGAASSLGGQSFAEWFEDNDLIFADENKGAN